MHRRDALKTTAILLGGALVACAPERPATQTGTLSDDDRVLAESIADTLLPTTAASPGATAAGVGATMNLLLTDCYDATAQRKVARGLADFRVRCRDRCGAHFAALSQSDRERFVRDVDAEARKVGEAHYFHLVRELATRAYFSSEIGMTQARRYIRVPGTWVGCTPRTPGQPAWG